MPSNDFFSNGCSTNQVLIVGAGTTGLYLALALQRNGVTPRIIEKLTAPGVGQRGAMIWPRTLEIMECLGFLDRVTERAVAHMKMRPYLPGTMEPSCPDFRIFVGKNESPDTPYTDPVFLGQKSHQSLVASEFPKYNLQLERGVELVSLEQCGDFVTVKLRHEATGSIEEARFKYIVGCDGARGAVRRHIGLRFQGESRVQKFIVGDLVLPELTSDAWHLWGSVSDVMVYLRPTDIKGTFALQVGGAKFTEYPEIFESNETLKRFLVKISGNSMFEKADIPFNSPYSVNIRKTETFRSGRVFLAGDACHLHTPAGGQGLNTGIQDAYNLGWKLALAAKDLAQPALLDSYNDERVPVVDAMLQVTTGIWNLASEDLASAMRNITSQQELNQLGINYRRSGVVLDDEIDGDKAAKDVSPYGGDVNGKLYAGDRAPDAPNLRVVGGAGDTRLFKIFEPCRHTVLIFAARGGNNLGMVTDVPPDLLLQFVFVYRDGAVPKGYQGAKGQLTVEDTKGHAYSGYHIKPDSFSPTIFVVRPDGYIGARVHNLKGVEEYFRAILRV